MLSANQNAEIIVYILDRISNIKRLIGLKFVDWLCFDRGGLSVDLMLGLSSSSEKFESESACDAWLLTTALRSMATAPTYNKERSSF